MSQRPRNSNKGQRKNKKARRKTLLDRLRDDPQAIDHFLNSKITGSRHTTPRMWPVSIVLVIWVALAAFVAWHIYGFFLNSSDLVEEETTQLEVIQVVLAVMAALGAVFLGVYAYRKQRLQEVASLRDDQLQFLTRYNAATEQLAHEKSAARLAGVYAMARLADDWPAQRQQCVDVLCAYLRMPPEETDGDREVRSTVIRVIFDHLTATSRRVVPVRWSNLDFNFDRAHLYDVSLVGATFTGSVSFQGTKFIGDTKFIQTNFWGRSTNWQEAIFEGHNVRFEDTNFGGASTSFSGVTFNANTHFFDASFYSTTTSFAYALFNGTETSFKRSFFNGQETLFHNAKFGSLVTLFPKVAFSSDLVTFDASDFQHGVVKFDGAYFNGLDVTFSHITLDHSRITFDDVKIEESTELTGLDTVYSLRNSSVTKDGLPFDGRRGNRD